MKIKGKDAFCDLAVGTHQARAAHNADQVEALAISNGAAVVSEGLLDEVAASSLPDEYESMPNLDEWEREQTCLDDLEGALLMELQRREALMGTCWPFRLGRNGIEYSPSKNGVYECCLQASIGPTKTTSDANQIPASGIFEWISTDCMKAYIGDRGFSKRCGWPRFATETGRETSFKGDLFLVEQETGELRWAPKPPLPDTPSHKYLKDGGVDVIGWKHWPDQREGLLFFFGQCAAGKAESAKRKTSDVTSDKIERWVKLPHEKFVRSLFVSAHIPNRTNLAMLTEEGGLVFDRCRISILLDQCDVNYVEQHTQLLGARE